MKIYSCYKWTFISVISETIDIYGWFLKDIPVSLMQGGSCSSKVFV